MAIYRQVHTKIWGDAWFRSLSPTQRYLWIYLFTNDAASISGIYEITQDRIAFDTGLGQLEIIEGLSRFQEENKIFYDGAVIWVVNLRKYHETSSSRVQKRIQTDFDSVQDCEVKFAYAAYHDLDYRPSSPLRTKHLSRPAPALPTKETPETFEPPESLENLSADEATEEEHSIIASLSDRVDGVAEPFSDYVSDRYYSAARTLVELGADAKSVKAFLRWWKSEGCWYKPPAPIALKIVPKEYKRWMLREEYQTSKPLSLKEKARRAVNHE